MLVMSVTESWSYTSKLGLDFIGKARRVLSLPRKSLLFFSCPQCWHLAGSLAATQQYCSSEAAEMFWHCIVLRPKKKPKTKDFPWLQSDAVGPPAPFGVAWRQESRERVSVQTPLPFSPKAQGLCLLAVSQAWRGTDGSSEAISEKEAITNSC